MDKLLVRKIDTPSAERVFTIEAPLSEGQTLILRYVPDREMVECEDFQSWLKNQSKHPVTIEELTIKVGNHFYDSVLPRYMDLKIQHTREDGLIGKAYFIHHQPEYKLPEILQNIFR